METKEHKITCHHRTEHIHDNKSMKCRCICTCFIPEKEENVENKMSYWPNRQVMEHFEMLTKHIAFDEVHNSYHPEAIDEHAIVREEILSRMYNPDVVKIKVKHT